LELLDAFMDPDLTPYTQAVVEWMQALSLLPFPQLQEKQFRRLPVLGRATHAVSVMIVCRLIARVTARRRQASANLARKSGSAEACSTQPEADLLRASLLPLMSCMVSHHYSIRVYSQCTGMQLYERARDAPADSAVNRELAPLRVATEILDNLLQNGDYQRGRARLEQDHMFGVVDIEVCA
jgi:hypothetical protein